MSTAPDAKDLSRLLTKLIDVSQEILACDPQETARLEALMNDRDPLFEAAMAIQASQFSVDEKNSLAEQIAELRTLDQNIEKQFQDILSKQAEGLRDMKRNRQALSAYTFPSMPSPPGVENQG